MGQFSNLPVLPAGTEVQLLGPVHSLWVLIQFVHIYPSRGPEHQGVLYNQKLRKQVAGKAKTGNRFRDWDLSKKCWRSKTDWSRASM